MFRFSGEGFSDREVEDGRAVRDRLVLHPCLVNLLLVWILWFRVIYIYIYIYIYIHINIYTHTRAHTHTHTHTHIYICIHIHTHTPINTYIPTRRPVEGKYHLVDIMEKNDEEEEEEEEEGPPASKAIPECA